MASILGNAAPAASNKDTAASALEGSPAEELDANVKIFNFNNIDPSKYGCQKRQHTANTLYALCNAS
jgi:hypothetical protein